jgi:hypothetical protein
MAKSFRAPLEPDKDAAWSRAQAETEALRDISDVARMRELLTYAQGLAAWVGQFDAASPATLLAAGAVGLHGIDALLLHIDDTLLRLAPYEADSEGRRGAATRGDAEPSENPKQRKPGPGGSASKKWLAAKRQFSKTLNYFRYLHELVAGNLRQEPDLKYPYEESPENVPWHWTWEPADEETREAALQRYWQFPKHRLLQRSVTEAQRIHDRIARLGRYESLHLARLLQREDTPEGFPRIRELVGAMETGPKKARAKAALKKFERLMLAISGLVPEPASGDPKPFGEPHQEFFATNLGERFIGAGRGYVEHCLPLLEKRRGSLQGIRTKVSRWIATVAQYAFLASGNGLYRRFAEVVAAVDLLSGRLKEDIAKLLDSSAAKQLADEDELQNIVRELNKRVVEPKVLGRWQTALGRAGAKAGVAFYGKAIETIVSSQGKQTKPWSRGDVLPALRLARLVTAKAQRKKLDAVTDACYSMQPVGLAVQVPLEHLLIEGSPSPKRKGQEDARVAHEGLPWIVNPLGAVLADVSTKRGVGRKRRARKSRAKQSVPLISFSQRANGIKPTKSGKKVAAKSRLPTTKAAKKWPHA